MSKSEPHLWARITPSGIRIDLIATFTKVIEVLNEGDVERAIEYAETFRELFYAAAVGRYDLIEQGYESAVIKHFESELSSEDELAKLLEEDK